MADAEWLSKVVPLKIEKKPAYVEDLDSLGVLLFSSVLRDEGKLDDKKYQLLISLGDQRLEVNIPTYIIIRDDPGRREYFHDHPEIITTPDFREVMNRFIDLAIKYQTENENKIIYEISAPVEDYFRKIEAQSFDEVFVRIPIKKGERILDLCCGTGHVTKKLAERVGKNGTIVGIDNHDTPLEYARKTLANNKNVKIVKGDVDLYTGNSKRLITVADLAENSEMLPKEIGNKKFDKVTIFDAMGYLNLVTKSLCIPLELNRVLKKGGEFIFSNNLDPDEMKDLLDHYEMLGLKKEKVIKNGYINFYIMKNKIMV